MRDLIPSRGRPGTVLLMSVERELTQDDLIRFATKPRERVGAPVLQKLRASHHAMARHLASGKNAIETANLVGRTPQRVRDLERDDPAFRQLVEYYRDQINETVITDQQRIHEKLVDVAELAIDEIQDRLEDPERIKLVPIGELRQIGQFGADRTVAPPKTAVPNAAPPMSITFNMGQKDIRKPSPGDDAKDITPKKE